MTRVTVQWRGDPERRARLEAELRRIVRELPRLGVRKAILFGSLVSGAVGAASDLDLILIAPSAEPVPRRVERFSRALGLRAAVDLFVYTPDEFTTMAETNSFVRSAVARGTVVYEA